MRRLRSDGARAFFPLLRQVTVVPASITRSPGSKLHDSGSSGLASVAVTSFSLGSSATGSPVTTISPATFWWNLQ